MDRYCSSIFAGRAPAEQVITNRYVEFALCQMRVRGSEATVLTAYLPLPSTLNVVDTVDMGSIQQQCTR